MKEISKNRTEKLNLINLFKKNGYLTNAAIMSTIYVICGCATFFGTHELKNETKLENKFFSSLVSCLKHKPFSILLLIFLFNMLTVDVLQTNIA
jgi:Na+/melibiose symporter-like transporter